ncbi:TolC family protein [Salinarimonas sp. NSM]|uniref:TolC family protein n=1 Tax=Salinarimonas sp. NSM TaxID=3458003 RepID=UPI004035541E
MVTSHSSRAMPSSRRACALGAVGAFALFLGGCAMTPNPLSLEEQIVQAAQDRAVMYASQQPISGPVTLEEALARAIKYNLDHRVALMQRALEDRALDVATVDLLPEVVGRAGYRTRDNVQASSSRSILSGRESLEPSTSTEEVLRTADLQASFSTLDFGLSYYGAKAQANRLLAAEQQRRRIVIDIADQVRAAYWEAVTAEQLQPRVAQALAEARQALSFARQAEDERLLPPLETLQFQRALLEIVQQLEVVESELAIAKAQLAGLMNLQPGTRFTLAPPRRARPARLPYRLDDLEAVAMVQRPEIQEELYVARNVVLETRSEILRLLPGLSLFGGVNYDSNDFLVNNSWADAGVSVTWNLLRLVAVPSILAEGEARQELAETRRLALRMAILTQVNLAYRRYQRAHRLYDRSASIERVEQRIAQATRAAEEEDASNLLERVRAQAASVLATRSRNRAFAEVQNALGSVYAAAGLDPLPTTVEDGDLETLAAAIAAMAARIDAGRIELPTVPPAQPVPVAANVPAAVYAAIPPARPAAE